LNDIIASYTVNGQLPSIKNRRRLVRNRRTGQALIIKSVDAMEYESMFLSKIPEELRVAYEGPVSLKMRVWYQSRRSDLSVEFLFDLLAKAGIILNDRQIRHVEAFGGLDKQLPRVHFTVSKYTEESEDGLSLHRLG